jgi:hypothetical protein
VDLADTDSDIALSSFNSGNSSPATGNTFRGRPLHGIRSNEGILGKERGAGGLAIRGRLGREFKA